MTEGNDKRDERHSARAREGDKKVEGYWKRISVPRDSEDREARRERVLAASAGRKARAEAAAAAGGSGLRGRFARLVRMHLVDAAAVLAVVVIALAVGMVIISEQKASLPAWVPIFGQDFFHLDAELQTAQALTPGQGQAVMIAGIEVGQISSTTLEDGKAIVGMDIEPEYAPVIRADAGLLPRPKTNLQDMVVQIDPGTPTAPPIEDNATIPLSNTAPNVNPDEFLARLDQDTRSYLQLLLQGGGEGLGGRGKQLSKGLRRIEPFSRYIAQLNGSLDKRRDALARVVHDFRLLTQELSRHDREIGRFVDFSAEALGGFADQQQAIRESLQELPSALATTRGALGTANRLSTELKPTLTQLIPQAKALGPGLDATADLFKDTTPTLRDQLRPFAEQVRPVVRHTMQLSDPLEKTVKQFGGAVGELNYGFNELAYNPSKSKPGFLFYLAWLNHNLNSGYSMQSATGPFRRGMVLMTCNTTRLANRAIKGSDNLKTVYQATNIPDVSEIC